MPQFGTGLVKQPEDSRDFNFSFLSAGAAPIDWSKPFQLPEPPDHNQGTSDSCVAHGTSYLHWQFNKADYSRRDLFSRIALNYGAYLRDGVKTICDIGQQTKDECPDPVNQTPTNMRQKSQLPDSAGADDKELRYFAVGASIEQLAQGVRDWQGCTMGIYTAGWTDLTNPSPAMKADGGHCLHGFGFHTHNGKKCLIAKSSWCSANHHVHHINEDHFTASRVFDGWVVVPREAVMTIKRYVVNKNGKLGVLVSVDGDGVFSDTILWAKSEAHLANLKKDYEIPADAPVITYP